MKFVIWGLIASLLLDTETTSKTDETDVAVRAQSRRMFDALAADYELVRKTGSEPLQLVPRPVYTWARSLPNGGAFGNVYVWTVAGNAESVGCIWHYPGNDGGPVSIVHELHSLSADVIESTGNETDLWMPKAGLQRRTLEDAAIPATSATGRLQQMRNLCRDFSARSVSPEGDRVELRLLPQPLYRDQSSNPEIIDGGLFAYVCSIGTDPEVFLRLEAVKTTNGPRWHCVLARFSHLNLYVDYKGKEIWRSIRDQNNDLSHNPDDTYRVFHHAFDRAKFDLFKKD